MTLIETKNLPATRIVKWVQKTMGVEIYKSFGRSFGLFKDGGWGSSWIRGRQAVENFKGVVQLI